jgi:PAS domain S-box-containing protein
MKLCMNFNVKLAFIFIILLLMLPQTSVASKQAFPPEIESWETISPTQKNQTVINWIDKSSDRIHWSHKARMEFANSAFNHAKLMENEELKMKAMFSLAELYFNEAEFAKALEYLDTIKIYAADSENFELLIKTDNYISSIFRYRGEIFEALGLAYDAYLLASEHDKTSLIALSANNLGVIYRNLEENKIALNYYNEALEMALMASDTNQIITSYSGMGNFFWFEKEAETALEYYNKAMHLAKNSNDLQHIASLNNNIGNIFRINGDYDNALFHYDAALELLEEVNVTGLKAIIIRNIGLVQQQKGNYTNSLERIYQSLEISSNIGIESFVRENYLTLSQLYESTGKISEAYKYLMLYTEINQHIHNNQLTNRISYFNDKVFNAQRKEELYKYRLQRNLFILIFVILFLVSLSLVSFLILRRSKESRRQYTRLKHTLQDKIIIEKALRQSEENYQTLIKTLNEGLIVLDKNNRIEFLNLKASKILGTNDKNELYGHNFEEFLLTPEDEKLYQEKVELQKMGISDHYEIKMKNMAGDVLWAHLSSAPILDQDLKTKGSVALISDVTEKKKSEQTYSELTANLNQKIKQLNCLYDITDISGVPGITFEDIMEKSLEIIPVGLRYSHDIGVQIVFDKTTYSSKNFIDSPWSYSVPIKVQKKKLGYIKVAYVEEKPNINKDPFHFNEKILLKNISEKFGKIIESKNLERVLRENQQKLEEVQRIAKIGNWEKDFASENCIFSETFFDIANISPERRKFFDYSKLVEIIHPDDKDVFIEFEKKLIEGKLSHDNTANYRIITNEGSIKFIFSSGKIIFDEHNNQTGCVFTVQDITEQKYTQELQHHAELALKTSEAKQQVLANLSYEMRTPITGIMGMTDFLLDSGLTDSQMELAKTIKDSSIGLLNSVNNILDLQRIEAGKFRLNNTVFSLSQLINKINSLFTALTRSKEIDLSIDIQPDIPENIISDQERLYQVITSLISIITENASGKGNIIIKLRKESIKGERMMVIVEIIDNFSKIDITEVNSILYPNKNLEDSLLQKRDNLSVGLAISRKLVDMLEGNIGVEKNKKGTTFYFTFFTTIATIKSNHLEDKQSPQTIISKLKGLKVLVVEDQKINQKVISLMLSYARCNPTIVNNGKEAIELLEKEEFDIVLLDMVMPVLDGIETLKIINLKSKPHPPIIALSANVLDEDKERYFAAGVQDFISKPINAEELYSKIEMWHNSAPPPKKTRKSKIKAAKTP